VFFYILNSTNALFSILTTVLTFFFIFCKKIKATIGTIRASFIGEGFGYVKGLILIFLIDACVTDDEPL